MNAIFAVASVVIKELYRRKDFYVLFVLTVLMTLVMASANILDDDRIARYLKEICLLLIWVSALVMAVTTAARQIPAEREHRTIFSPARQACHSCACDCWEIPGLLARVRCLADCFLPVSRHRQRIARSRMAGAQLYWRALWLQWIFLAVVISAMVLLGSIIFTAPATNATLCLVFVLGILLLSHHLSPQNLQRNRMPFGTALFPSFIICCRILDWFDVRDLVLHNRGLVGQGWIALAGHGLRRMLHGVFHGRRRGFCFSRPGFANQ